MTFRSLILLSGTVGTASSLLLSSASFAQENLQLAEAYIPGMADEVLVTASRSPETVKETLASSTVITREQIERSQARNLYQILKTTQGVYMRNTGGRASQTSISMRGMTSSGTLVMVDGVRVESGSSGAANLQQITADQIERIEIVRGSRSSLYGSAALGGVIQIFTRKAKETGVTLSAGYGSQNTRSLIASASGVTDRSEINVTASYDESDGYDIQYGDDAISGPNTYPFDDDPYEKTDVSLHASTDITDSINLFASAMRNAGENEYDDSYNGGKPYIDYETLIMTVGAEYQSEVLLSRFQVGRLDEDSLSDDYTDPRNTGNYGELHSQRDQAIWENTYQISEGSKLRFGAEYYSSDTRYMTGYGSYDEGASDRDRFSGYVNSKSELGSWVIEGGVRHDDDDQFGSELTGDAGIGYWFDETLRISLTGGNAFKAPTNNDLYYPGYGNPDLKPEESRTVELGIDSFRENSVASLHLFQVESDNLIAYNPIIYGPENIAQSRVTGAEVNFGTEILGVQAGFGFTWQKPEELDSGEDLAYVPRQFGSIDLDKSFGKADFGMTLYAQGDQLDSYGDEMGGFATLALRAAYQISPALNVRLRVDNLLDRDYVETTNYNTEGLFAMFYVDFTLD